MISKIQCFVDTKNLRNYIFFSKFNLLFSVNLNGINNIIL